jgi:lipoprotein-releasing system ATP-binding protein
VAEDALVLSGIRKSFGIGSPAEVEILHGIDITLERGAFCALIGPSGSGKSTLLNIIGLLDRQSAGRLAIGGQDTLGLDDAALTRLRGRSIGFVFQAHNLIPAFTAAENVMMPLLLSRGWADAAMRLADDVVLVHVFTSEQAHEYAVVQHGHSDGVVFAVTQQHVVEQLGFFEPG